MTVIRCSEFAAVHSPATVSVQQPVTMREVYMRKNPDQVDKSDYLYTPHEQIPYIFPVFGLTPCAKR